MVLWIVFAAMTAAAVLCVVWPLTRRPDTQARSVADVEFYRAQMASLDDDVARGMLPAEDAAGTRAELGRRLLAAGDRSAADHLKPSGRIRLAAALVTLCVVPAVGLGLYLYVGNPGYPDVPLASREAPSQNIAAIVEKVEGHLASHPDDGRGFELVAPIYLQMGRFGDAARAYRQAIRLLGDTADREAALGQSLLLEADGVVTAEARQALDAALKLDPNLPQARFFTGVAAEQDGDKDKARTIWQALLASAPAGAPYADVVRRRIAALDNPAANPPGAPGAAGPPSAGGPPSGPMAAGIAALPPEQRNAAIRGMVDGLAARLAANGSDPDGWLRLVRAYTVLGETDKARQALVDARRSMVGNQEALSRIDGLAHELGLEG